MSTTALFVEVLIAGIEAFVWLSLLFLIVAGSGTISLTCLSTAISKIGDVKGWETLVSVFLLANAYVLGVIVDRFADWTYRKFEKSAFGKWINSVWGGGSYYFGFPASIDEMRLQVLKDNKSLAEFFDYQRSRARIARATVFNLSALIAGLLSDLT